MPNTQLEEQTGIGVSSQKQPSQPQLCQESLGTIESISQAHWHSLEIQ